MLPPRAVSLVDPFASGHHVGYATWLTAGLLERGVRVQLIGSRRWMDGVLAGLDTPSQGLSLQALELHPDPQAYFGLPTPRREAVDLRFLRAAGRAARAHGSDTVHLLWLDRFILPLLAAWPSCRSLNVQATLHWPTPLPRFRPTSRSGRLRAQVEGWALGQLQRQGLQLQLHSEQVAQQLNTARKRSAFVPYPTPLVEAGPAERTAAQSIRSDLGLQETDRLLLAFGGTRYDKGADLAAQLLSLLPEHIHLLVAGQAEQFGADTLRALAGPAAARLHLRLDFVAEHEVNPLFLAADALLLPYRRVFAGQSGPLTTAAGLGVPVVAADVGLLTETVQRYQLGSTFASEHMDQMTRAVQATLSAPGHPRTMAFQRDHAPDAFVEAVLRAYRREGQAETARSLEASTP